ncbi:ComEA family DNA-binding protein [Persicitalea jodogahamensis]|uniref:Competence protein ComEA n=1 Tax=Persicitalea jodogahamensis TaxID=402147 RepID=A0A8J3GAR6_9BACT|nr:helix-hairpin-helix domain-containing protein [Persicitalea jodogahamensis]GHB76070.1 competence protein ComEA [Persicitalea jodogahamensis]
MLRRLLRRIQDFFGISPAESRGALVLILLSFGLVWAPTVYKWWVLPLFQDDTIPFTIEYLDSTAALIPGQSSQFGQERDFARSTFGGNDETPARPTRLFIFDPNTASPDQLQELGIPRFLALRIEKYRQKGGRFRRKEDLQKIYDFPPALFAKLEPYIELTSSTQQPGLPNAGFEENPTRETTFVPPNAARPFARPTPVAFDINTADTTQLATLRGIGSKLSARIVKFRDALGGFHSTEQYSEVFGLDSLALAELRRYGRVQTPPQKININTATIEELSRHPYFRNRKLNEVIVRYREQHGPYASFEAMKSVRILDDATLKKWMPYLAF